tara:strand:+ start:967 stop:1164 length:198 start_codon:yes stop_codon:yes gene_type:complete
MAIFITEAILQINPDADVRVANNNIDQIEWLNGTPEISKADIQAKIIEMENSPKPEWLEPEGESE